MDEAEAIKCARLMFQQALEKLQHAAEMLRSPLIPASPSQMRTEQVVTRAIESLTKTGFMPEVPPEGTRMSGRRKA